MYKPFYNLTDKEASLLLEQIRALEDSEEIVPLSQEEVDKIEAEYIPIDVSASLNDDMLKALDEYRSSWKSLQDDIDKSD